MKNIIGKAWRRLLLINIAAGAFIAQAEVVLDGTLGPGGLLPGPNISISASIGQQQGDNLFHSFDRFSLKPDETATFYGPASIRHLISRVTGGRPSMIDGALASALPNADVYFINPAGVAFGPDARFDVPASLHVSTADYLRLGDSGRFDAARPANSSFTAAPPSAFGFLSDHPGSISKKQGFLELPAGKTLSLTGNDIQIHDVRIDNGEYPSTFIKAPGGIINLVSVDSPGEIPLTADTVSENAVARWGNISVTYDSKGNDAAYRPVANLDVSGNDGGKVFIRGGKVFFEHAYVFADTAGETDGRGIEIKAADSLELTQHSRITSEALTKANGKAGDIHVEAPYITIKDGSQITSASRSLFGAAAGNIRLTARDRIEMSGQFSLSRNERRLDFNAGLLSNAIGTGRGGNIAIKTPHLHLGEGAAIRAGTHGFGSAGNIEIQAGAVKLTGGGRISVSAGGERNHTAGTGYGGAITINAAESILIDGHAEKKQPSGLRSNVFTKGKGGSVIINTPLLEIKNSGSIESGTAGAGNAGRIQVSASTLTLRQNGQILSSTSSSGKGGTIELAVNDELTMTESNISANSREQGNAGDIILRTGKNLISQGGGITTSAKQASGGNITIASSGYLYLADGKITTSVLAEDGNGGDITLAPEFLILDSSPVIARAFSGRGGDINIATSGIFEFSESPIDATSQLGIDGTVQINAPDADLEGELFVAPTNFLIGRKLSQERCSARMTEASSMLIKGRGGIHSDEIGELSLGSYKDIAMQQVLGQKYTERQ
ncbi:MAG: filamentous hemagglutinin N-terminal domain-containing protein [Gammaproteobacteria bacterium]|nr:filamentous hemagglutinin N-terminal domain-containing protein [Gammaproteobacteria bacterium]